MSSGSKARAPSDRHDPTGGGSAGSTKEAGQCPRREAAEQDSALDEGYTAAPEAEPTVATKLAELAARARRERTLTNVIQFVSALYARSKRGSRHTGTTLFASSKQI